MEANEEKAADKESSWQEESREGVRVLSVDRLTVETIVLDASSGTRRILLTKNETSRKLSVRLAAGEAGFTPSRDERNFAEAKGSGKRSSLPEDVLAPTAGVDARPRQSRNVEERIKPIKLTKCPSIGAIAVPGLNADRSGGSAARPAKVRDAAIAERTEESVKVDTIAEEDVAKETKVDARDRLEKSRSNIGVLQQNLNAKIDATTALEYKRKLLESSTSRALKSPVPIDSNDKFDEDFPQKRNLDGRLEIEENGPLQTEPIRASNGGRIDEESDETVLTKRSAKPSYGKRVTEVEKRWSGEFLENRLERRSSESSKSSYVEEFGSVSSGESVGEHRDREPRRYEREQRRTEPGNGRSSGTSSLRNRESVETLAGSTVSTVDSDSCLEDRIKAVEEDIEERDRRAAENVHGECHRSERVARDSWKDEPDNRARINSTEFAFIVGASSSTDGYANLIREFTMEAGSSRAKKEAKQKRKLGLRRLLPGFFSPKDSRKDYKSKKESKERKRPDDRHFARYQQNGNYTRSPDTMNLNEDIKRNVKLDNSLNGSMIEERLDEIKRELFSDQGPITSTPDHLAREADRAAPRSYTTDSSLSSIAPDDRWPERNAHLGISPDVGKFEQRQRREELGQRYGQLERKHSLQESSQPARGYAFQRNHGPSGRISAPPSERYLFRPRAVHPMDRPLPAIPRSRTELSGYVDHSVERGERPEPANRYGGPSERANEAGLYENTGNGPAGLTLKSVSAQVKITRQPIVNQNQRAPLVGRSPKYLSSGSSQKSGDCGDSSCTPNSSQKSGFSPSSSKSGEYYLHSSRNSGSPNEHDVDEEDARRGGIYENEKSPSGSSSRCIGERVYDETPGFPSDQRPENRRDGVDPRPRRSPLKGERPLSPRRTAERATDAEREPVCSSGSARGPSSPAASQGVAVSPIGSRQCLPPSRRAQPNEQILIASPKREVACDARIPRPTNESRRWAVESPVNMTSAPCKLVDRDGGAGNGGLPEGSPTAFPVETTRPEPVYGPQSPGVASELGRPPSRVSPDRTGDRVAWVPARASSPPASPLNAGQLDDSTSTESHRRGQPRPGCVPPHAIEGQRFERAGPDQRLRPQRAFDYGAATTGGPLSPSRRVTRQHLEAFYWQQKAIEAHRKSLAPPANPNARRMGRKIDLPEVREAVYWQQLKRLDEEQQRRIYEQNAAEEGPRGNDSTWSAANLPVSVVHGDHPAPWTANVRCPKANPASGKPPLMQNQKGQNQPVLIVRPQRQAIRERREIAPSMPPDVGRQEAQRSKSASPSFRRGETVPRKLDGFSTREVDASEADGKAGPPPPPIFKRGSLIGGGESMEYGGTGGAKRVSFSNQSNPTGREVASGSWPTKHGTAPEPPTRRHRSEDSVSDTDSVLFHHREPRRDAIDYDADRPLPPLPKDLAPVNAVKPAAGRGNAYGDVRWNSAIDSRPPASPRRAIGQNEEEWNSDGKGRQSNDTGGSGRGEVEAGSNEPAAGRRGGGGIGSGGAGVGGGGNVLVVGGSGGRSGSGGGGRSRDEPRRHTLGGDHQPSLHHQQFNAAHQLHPLHPHHLPPPHGQYGTPPTRHTTMDLEMGTKSRQRKSPLPRGYPPPSSTMLFDDDPGIMSEVETASTGFRRGGKQRSSLPVVRTPSKTLERPLGLVFLQYRNETKRALLPNEITSIDTVKALFVRSFPKQLTMEYLDSPRVKVYIHDSNKDMFYELEDDRSHLRDIRDRSVLRLFESSDGVTGMPGPLGIPGVGAGLPPHWEDQSYFSEPEFDSEYQHQHIHKSKTAKNSTSGSSGYYIGGSSTLPRGGSLMRAYSPAASSIVGGPSATPTQPKPLGTPGGGRVPPAKPLRSYQCGKSPLESLGGSARFSRDSSVSLYSIADRLHGESGYMSSPERGGGVGSGTGRYPPGPYSAGSSYEDPYYSQYSGTVTPVIDEEASDTELLEESYSLYGVKPPGRPPSGPPRSPFPPGAPPPLPPGGQSYDVTRIRVEHMERQLANLTGLVQKALTHAPHTSPSPRDYLQVPAGRDPYARGPGAGDEFDKHSSSSSASLPDDSYLRTDVKPPKLGKDKSVSFEKSVSFSDEPPDMNSPKQHSPQHAADTKPTKPAIKSSTLPRMSSQERDRHKPTPPPKPAALVAGQYVYRDLALTPEMYNQLRGLQRKAKDLRLEVRNLRRMSQAQAHTIRETILDTFFTIRGMLLSCGDAAWDAEKIRLSREEDLYRQEMLRLKKDLTELENTVEELRGNVINKKTRVNMSDVENMALIMSKSSKTVADLKVRFPSLQEGMKGLLSSEMEMVVRAEKFLKEEPEQLELALKRCKKLTSTLVTLKRLASVQEQRLPNAAASIDAEETPPITPTSAQHSKAAAPVPAERAVLGSAGVVGGGSQPREPSAAHQQRPENALDALLDELQTFSRPSSQLGHAPAPAANRGEAAGATATRPPYISDIGRKGSVDSSSGVVVVGDSVADAISAPTVGGTLRRLHSYPSSSDTDTSPPIARLQQASLQEQPGLAALPQPGQKPPVPERNAELLQLASARRVPPPPPPRTSSRSPLASPTSPQLPPRNHSCAGQNASGTLRRPAARVPPPTKEGGKPPMALPAEPISALVVAQPDGSTAASPQQPASNSSSCESVNSQEGLQGKKGRQEQLEQRHQELLRKQKALQEQYARLQQLQRNTAGLTTVPPAPPDLLKKTGSESNLLAKMGLGLSAASSGSLTSLAGGKSSISRDGAADGDRTRQEESTAERQSSQPSTATTGSSTVAASASNDDDNDDDACPPSAASSSSASTAAITATTTTTSKIYETDIL